MQCKTRNYTLKPGIYPSKLSKAQNAFCHYEGLLNVVALVNRTAFPKGILSSIAVSQQLLKDAPSVLPLTPFS